MIRLPSRPAGGGGHHADTEQDLSHPVLSLLLLSGKTSRGVSSIKEVRE